MKSTNVEQCVDQLKKLEGLPPYDTWSNHCAGDGYFAASIERDFSPETVVAARKKVKKLSKKWEKARRAFING